LRFSVELPESNPPKKLRRAAETLNLTTRNIAKAPKMTCGYAKAVDGVNKFTNAAQVDTLHLRHGPRGFRALPT
jgi:hypothetical protein